MKRVGKEPLGRAVPDSENPSEEEPAGVSEPNREEENQIEDVGKGKRKAKAPREPRRVKAKEEVVEPELPLPLGVPLTTVAGIELHPQDVGHALQFIEFCVALEEVLKFSKEDAESLLRYLMHQRYSSIIRFQAKLLSEIQKTGDVKE
ncbi:uncharacterized protein LOC112191034 [Rosa chinensis]|uniref:uncharacterized protein LOC112191034 n=1 Tax=Rosa chinensis TaxID=74649 RepID=UPI001AD94A7F|nr:uncharacterized protein LOC112191034 [Rosa chinensis]